ncbi:hypothetical protein EVAR_87440_1 [Eumeta japonica]|uniref:Uncharacterized protein n=1 Tax=Eumeta variegata TaxID=151549 RepID=A0A4C1XI31_EUMVA|nr:hypothetical protein EVAR_87440_1 [Eumeta japonica]
MVLERGQRTTECDIIIKGEKAEQVKEFVYLGSLFTNDGKHDRYIERRGNVVNQVNGTLLAIMNSKSVSRQARLAVHSEALILTLMYGSESWIWQKKNEISINAVEMRSLHNICRVSRKDRDRNSDVRKRCGMKENIVTRVERGYLMEEEYRGEDEGKLWGDGGELATGTFTHWMKGNNVNSYFTPGCCESVVL